MADDGQPSVADVDVFEPEGADLGDPGRVDRSEGEDESCRWGGRRRDGLVDLFGDERLQDGVFVLLDPDPADEVAEGEPIPLGSGEQRSRRMMT